MLEKCVTSSPDGVYWQLERKRLGNCQHQQHPVKMEGNLLQPKQPNLPVLIFLFIYLRVCVEGACKSVKIN